MVILAIDNQKNYLEMLVEYLEIRYPEEKIVGFSDPLLAIQYVFQNDVDIVFTEIALRGIEGFKLSEGIRKKNPKAEIFFVTADDEYVMRAEEIGASGYYRKPILQNQQNLLSAR